MDLLDKTIKLIEFRKFRHVTLYWIETHPEVALIKATSSYIPIDDFKEAFTEMEILVAEKKITRLIFDKREMRVFHQPSMEWYFVDWKEKMARLGVHYHIKLLPDDDVFCESVKIGRSKIDLHYPKARFHELRIMYAGSIEEALRLD